MLDERLARFPLAGDDVDHPRWEARLGGEPERLEHARAGVLGRLDDDGVARGERRCERYIVSSTGEFQGMMIPTTPSGSRSV